MTKEALKLTLEALDTVMWHGGGSCWVVDADKIEIAITAIKEALAQPEERNFCPRCGKRTADLTSIHTCTPPQEK